jgi:hypothetical protein
VAWWCLGLRDAPESQAASNRPAPASASARRADTASLTAQVRAAHGRTGAIDWQPTAEPNELVSISGRVFDLLDHTTVRDVEVVLQSADGETSTRSDASGAFRITVPRGTYRAYVRDDNALSIGRPDPVRVPGPPTADAAEVPDDTLLPKVVATADVAHLDLSVLRGGVVEGRVVDRSGRPVADAVVRATGNGPRPALATDVARSDARGRFVLRLPPGHYAIDGTSSQLAGVADAVGVDVTAGETAHTDVTLVAGCVVTGRVIGPHGEPGPEGALESSSNGPLAFGPTGAIDSDGSFRWVTTNDGDIQLRAWPWKSPPSEAQTFTCHDGSKFENVVFQLPLRSADIAGVVVDAQGRPVAGAFVDLTSPDGTAVQQERSDATGQWGIYTVVPGSYHITVSVPGLGIATQDITAPVANVRLALSGVGKLAGEVAEVGDGSLLVQMDTCGGTIGLATSPRMVPVTDHKFVVDDVPACAAVVVATWEGKTARMEATVPAGGVANTTLDFAAGGLLDTEPSTTENEQPSLE